MSICSDPVNCPNGNCPGCRNGQIYCDDPRCYPDCPTCDVTTSSGNWIIIMIILILLGVLLVMAFIVGYDWYNKTQKANEPKNLTVNKHVHNIKQPPVIITSPTVLSVPDVAPANFAVSSPFYSAPPLLSTDKLPVSYEGISINEGCS